MLCLCCTNLKNGVHYVEKQHSMKVIQKKAKNKDLSIITVKDDGAPVSKAHILLIAENNIFFEGHTNESGVYIFRDLPTGPYSIYIAHQSYCGHVVDNYNPNKDLEITIKKVMTLGH